MKDLQLDDQPPKLKKRGSGSARKILADQISNLIDIFPPPTRAGDGGQGVNMLLLNLRSAGEFEASHIYGAVSSQLHRVPRDNARDD